MAELTPDQMKRFQPVQPQVQPQPFPGAVPQMRNPRLEAAAAASAQEGVARGQTIIKNQRELDGADEIDDKTAVFIAHQVLAGGDMPPFGMGKAAARSRKLVMDKVTAIATEGGLGGADLATQRAHYQSARKAIGVLETQLGTVRQNEGTAKLNGQQFMDRSRELPGQTEMPLVNTIVQAAQRHLPVPGHETVAAMDVAYNTFTTEYAKVVAGSPSGAGVLSDSARHEQQDIMKGEYSFGQKQAAFDQMKKDMENRLTAIHSGLKTAYGDLTKNPMKVEDLQDAPGHKELSTQTKTVKLPHGYEQEHLDYLNQHPPGSLKTADYMEFRHGLDDKYKDQLHGAFTDLEGGNSFVNSYNNHPDRKVAKIGSVERKLSANEHEVATFGESPVGTFLAHGANALTAGLPELVAGKDGRDNLDLTAKENWKSALGGEVAGSIAPLAAIESVGIKGLTKLLPKLSEKTAEKLGLTTLKEGGKATARQKLVGDVAVNGAYGEVRGFNHADDGKGAEGALMGAAGGAVGAGVGNLVTKGVVPLLSEKTIAAVAKLKGVNLTTLQRLGLGKVEQAVAGLPGVHGARSKAIDSFNRANADRALTVMGTKVPKNVAPGTEMTAFVHDELSRGYNQIRPQVVGAQDGTFVQNLRTLKATANTPGKISKYREIEDAMAPFIDKTTGHFEGKGYQEANMELRGLIKTWGKAYENGDTEAGAMMRTAERARLQIQQLVQRKVPADVGQKLKGLERGWAHSVRIEDATERALATENGVYSPSQYYTSIKKLEPARGRAGRGKAYDQDYADAATRIMGSGPKPKLSLKETLYAGGAAGGVGYAAPGIIPPVAGAAAALYLPGLKQLVQKGLNVRGTKSKLLDNSITRKAIEDATRHELTGN